MLLDQRRQTKFEASCISLHLAQARSNLNDLSRAGSRGQRERSCNIARQCLPKSDEAANATPFAAQYSEFADSSGPGVTQTAAPNAGSSPPSMSSLPKDFAENIGRSTAGELGSSAGLAPMISSIAEGLHEELRGFLASFSSRLAAREAALAATCDRAATVGDQGVSELSKRVEDRLAAVAQQAAAEREAALDVVREGLHRLRNEVSAQHSRLESLVAGDDWGRQLREASRAFEQRSALRVEAVERHVEELRAKDAAGHRAWRDAVIHRVDAVERRLSKHFKDSNNVIDQVGKMVPDVERLQSLYDKLQADCAAADTWQRRLFNCEAATQRLAAMEVQCNAAERQSERFFEETSQSLRESLRVTGNLAARVSTLESSERSRDELWKAAEKRVLAVVEQHHKRAVSSLDIFRENSHQRFTDFDTRFQQRLEHVREDCEHRVAALSSVFKRDLHSLSVEIDKLARTPASPRGHAQAESDGMQRRRRDRPTHYTYTQPAAASGSRAEIARVHQAANLSQDNHPTLSFTNAAPALSPDLPSRSASSAQAHPAQAELVQETESLTPTPEISGSRTQTASALVIAHMPRHDIPAVGVVHATPAESSELPLRSAPADSQMHRAPAEVLQDSRTEQREASSGRSSLIGVDFNPAQMELEASRVFSEADDCAHASRVSSEEYAAPGCEDEFEVPSPHSNLQEQTGNPGCAGGSTSSDVDRTRNDQIDSARLPGLAPASGHVYDSANLATTGQSSHSAQYDDADDDVEALMAQSMRAPLRQVPVSISSDIIHPGEAASADRAAVKHGGVSDEGKDIVDALLDQSISTPAHRTSLPSSMLAVPTRKPTKPGKELQADIDDDDADDDIEALMAQTMQNQRPDSAHSVHGSKAELSEQRPKTNDGARPGVDVAMGSSGFDRTWKTPHFDHSDAVLDADRPEPGEVIAANADPGDDFDFEADEEVDVEALIADTMDPQAAQGSEPQQAGDSLRLPLAATSGSGAASAVPIAEDDEEDVEALMARSMQNLQTSSSPLALQGETGMSRLSLRVGSNESRENVAAAPAIAVGAASGVEDDSDDDVEALMAGSMQRSQSYASSALQGRAGAGSLRLRVGSSNGGRRALDTVASAPAADNADNAAIAVEDDDEDDDVEALMAGSMQRSRPSSSPTSLQSGAGAASLRLRMGNVNVSRAVASAETSAIAGAPLGAGSAADSKDDDDDDDVEALMFGSMQAGRAAPGRRAAVPKRISSSVARSPGTQATADREKRLNALLGLGEDEDEED